MTPPISSPDASATPQAKIYQCGTLRYTSRHLMVLFFWLLWGDFCYTMMEAVTPSIMPLKFKALDASNFEIGLILGTIPAVIYSFLNPVISFKSDRYRSKLGRRIPFILYSLPFLVLCLIGLGFGDKVGFFLHEHLGFIFGGLSPNKMALLTIGFLMVVFTFFNTFVTSTFWYLFNDVVPEQLLARFMSWFRMISLGATALYQFCIFRFAESHYTEILIGAALLYLFAFFFMCRYVKEGEYPPPPPYVHGQSGPLAAIKTYAKECLTIKHYWFQWGSSFIGSIGAGAATFLVFFYMAIGLDLKQIGIYQGTLSLAIAVYVLGTGWLADRFHPIRVVICGAFLGVFIATPASLIWLFWTPPPQVAFWVLMVIALGLQAPTQALGAMADPPLLMRMFPRERYGQFCSTNAIWRAMGGVLGGGIAGGFLDLMGGWVGKERAFLFIPVWSILFAIPGLLFLLGYYRSWKRYGGDKHYVPPMIGVDGKEIVREKPAEPAATV